MNITEQKLAEKGLRESEDKLRNLIETSSDWLWEINERGVYTYVSPKVRDLLGYEPEEILGKTPFELRSPEEADLVKDVFAFTMTKREPFKCVESRNLHKEGHLVVLETSGVPFFDPNGTFGGYRGIDRDITERKQVEEALRRSEETARRLAQENAIVAQIGRIISSTLNIEEVYDRFAEEARRLISFDGIAINVIHHEEDTVTVPYVAGMALPACKPGDVLSLMGSVTGEVMRRRSGLIVEAGDREKLRRLFPILSGAFDVGLRSLMAVPLISKDQVIGAIHFRSLKPYAYSGQDLKLAESIGSQIAGAVANAQLYAECKRAEVALRESEQRFLVFMEHLPAAVFIKDQSGRLLFANRYLQEIFGWEECVGKTTEELVPREIAERMIADDRRILTEGPMVIQERIIDIRGAEHFFDTYKFPIPAEGTSVLLGGISVDITERKRAEERLRCSEEKYRTILENMEEGYYDVDLNGNLTFFNDSLCRTLGYTRDELMGMNYLKYTDPENAKKFLEISKRVYRTREPDKGFDLKVVGKDGTTRFVELSVSIIKGSGKHPIGFRGIARDVTERRRTEEAVRESEEKYRNILESIEDSYYEVDLPGNFTFFNDSLCRSLGYSREELVGMNDRQYTDPENVEKLYREFNKVYRTGEASKVFDWEIIRKDGTKRNVEASVSLIKDPGGHRIGFRGIVRDVTERKHAENMLRESEARFRDLVENSLTGIYIIQEGQIAYENSEQDRIFGPLPRPANFNDFENVHPEDVEKVKEAYEKILSGQTLSFDMDMRFFASGKVDSGADIKWVHSRSSVIQYQGKEAILVNMMDVTRTMELEHLARINDRMTSLGRIAAGIIHELRNPLSGINVYLTTLKKIYDSPESLELENLEKVEKILGKLQSASNKIESVIKRVMDFSKPTVPRLSLTSINRPIEEAINLCLVTCQKSGVKIEKSLCEDLPPCYSDPPLIEQVLLNLITNAAQAMKNQEGEKIIEITSAMESNRVVIRVADSGPGIPLMLRKKIFDPFFTTKKDGSGIGLSLCQRIICDHGGSLDIFTSKWGGSEFTIELPIEKRTNIQ